MRRITDLHEEPTVGQMYLVPCVRDRYSEWWPVMGPKHHDREIIGFDDEHYHRDIRFLSQRQLKWTMSSIRRRWDDAPDSYGLTVVLTYTRGDVTFRRLKCRRQMPDFPCTYPLAAGRFMVGEPATWFPALEDAYRDAKLSACLRCPHRGMPLTGLPKKEGVVVCPGHGLAFDLETGSMVSRLGTK